jgi:tetratricopeptide (TPR) repeat protein
VQTLASPQRSQNGQHVQDQQDQLVATDLDASPDELLARADTLLADEKRGRIARVFNWVLSTFDVGSLFLGAPRSPSLYSAQGVVSSLRNSDDAPSPRERKALVLYQEFLRRAPQDPRATAVREKADKLEVRRNNALVQDELAQAKAAFEEQDYWRANFHYQLALMIDEEAADAHAGIRQVEARLQRLQPLQEQQPEDPYERVKEAEWDHQVETFKYVMPGSSFVKDNFVVAGVQVATEGLVGAATFGALSAVQVGSKLWQVMMNNPVSREEVITEAKTYLHTTPPEKRTPEVYPLLAKSYQREGKFDQAIDYYKLAGQEDEIPKLEEQAAEGLLEQAKKSAHRSEKIAALRTLVERYPNTEAATQAAPQLLALSRWEAQGIQLSKAFLTENPDLIGPQGLGLKPQLLDGDWDNVELADAGITILADQEISLQLQTDAGPHIKVYGVPTVAWKQFWRRFREKGFERAAQDGDRELARLALGAEEADITLKSSQEKNAASGWRALPYLTGSTSGTSIDVRGTLPKEVLGTRLAFGKDQRSAFVGMEVSMPFIPVDFLLLGRGGMPSLYPKIRLPDSGVKDEELYK